MSSLGAHEADEEPARTHGRSHRLGCAWHHGAREPERRRHQQLRRRGLMNKMMSMADIKAIELIIYCDVLDDITWNMFMFEALTARTLTGASSFATIGCPKERRSRRP